MNRVLFVDDEPRVLDGIENLLFDQMDVWDVRTATSGAQALEMLERETYHVLVTDMRMPGMDGVALLEEVKQRWPSMVLFVLSGHAETDMLLQAMTIAHRYLAKPCDADTLIEALTSAFALTDLIHTPEVHAQLAQLTSIPPRPELFGKLQIAVNQDGTTFQDVADIIEQDAVIATRVLQVANSAFFGGHALCLSICDAVRRLGFETLRGLVAGMEVSHAFSGVDMEVHQQLYDDLLGVGCIARIIAKGEDYVDVAFLAGLLHDIGQLVFLATQPKAYATLLQDTSPCSELLDRERACFGASHAQVGAHLLHLWGFDMPIIEVVAHHHDAARALGVGRSAQQAVFTACTLFEEFTASDLAAARLENDALLNSRFPQDQIDRWRRDVTNYLETS